MRKVGIAIDLGVGVAVAFVVLTGCVAYAFLAPTSYRSKAIVQVEVSGKDAKPLPVPEVAARQLNARLMKAPPLLGTPGSPAPVALPKIARVTPNSPGYFTVSAIANEAETAQRLCNAIAEKVAKLAPGVFGPAPEPPPDAKELERRRRIQELAAFVAEHPEVAAEPTSDKEPVEKEDEVLARLLAEQKRLEVAYWKSTSTVGQARDAAPDAPDPEALKQRLGQVIAAVDARRRAVASKAAAVKPQLDKELLAEWRKKILAVAETGQAPEQEVLDYRVTAAVSRPASLPEGPIFPDRARILTGGALVALGSVFAGVFVSRTVRRRRRANKRQRRTTTSSGAPPAEPGRPELPFDQTVPAPESMGDDDAAPQTARLPGTLPALDATARIVATRRNAAPADLPPPTPRLFTDADSVAALRQQGSAPHNPAPARGAPHSVRKSQRRWSPISGGTMPLGSLLADELPKQKSSSSRPPPPADPGPRFSSPPPPPPKEPQTPPQIPAAAPVPAPKLEQPSTQIDAGSADPERPEAPPAQPATDATRLAHPPDAPAADDTPGRTQRVPGRHRDVVDPAEEQVVQVIAANNVFRPSSSLNLDGHESLRDELYSLALEQCFTVTVAGQSQYDEATARIAAALSQSLAESGHPRILLVDANLQRPSIHRHVGIDVPIASGFSQQLHNRLHGKTSGPWTVVRRSPTLHVLAEGLMRSPGMVLSTQFEECLGDLKTFYDLIVVNGPHISTEFDCRALDALTDGLILVSPDSGSPQETLARTFFTPKRFLAVIPPQAAPA